jgi:hypothetical protein
VSVSICSSALWPHNGHAIVAVVLVKFLVANLRLLDAA